MREILGADYPGFAQALQTESPTGIRLNPNKFIPISTAEKIPWTEYGFYLRESPSFTSYPLFHAGAYYVQEASSMFLEQAARQSLNLSRPIIALDLCAAPGGKSTHLASLLSE